MSKADKDAAEQSCVRLAIAGLSDSSPAVRVRSLEVLTQKEAKQAADAVEPLASDPDPAVRSAVQGYLSRFAGASDSADAVVASLGDADATLRNQAIAALAHSPKSPPQISSRRLWPFLRDESGDSAAAQEVLFPSRNGTVPMVSPDGQWVAYVETGWGRAGGSGGLGRSNLTSLVHAVRADGSDDRLVADMFLVSWLSDSKHIASARDGFASICDLQATVTVEFGSPLEEKWAESYERRGDWTKGNPREQFGGRMPHSKRLDGLDNFEWGEDAAFSPNGKWFGPIRSNSEAAFVGSTGERVKIRLPGDSGFYPPQVTWSPDGKNVVLISVEGGQSAVINFQSRSSAAVTMDAIPKIESWTYRKSRWNPWSRDGSWLAFVRQGQVWISRPDGADAKQLTFDTTRKAFPTFSRDGKQIAYVSWQTDDRLHYTRLGPTDLWIVDVASTLVTRATLPGAERIHSLDWLDDYTLIFDRLDSEDVGRKSSLRKLSLLHGG